MILRRQYLDQLTMMDFGNNRGLKFENFTCSLTTSVMFVDIMSPVTRFQFAKEKKKKNLSD